MKNPIVHLNRVFDSRIRIGVMSILSLNETVNFNDLKQLMNLTDGNLASHLVNLEENGYIKVHKGFIGRKTNTTYTITKTGEKAFKQHIDALENLIKGVK
jgi:DNA-binding MarR family transcriptional regulator